MFLSVYQTVKTECIVLANVMHKSSTHTYQECIVMVVVDCPEARSYALIPRDVSVQRCHIDGDQYHVTFEGSTFDFFDELGRVLDIAILCTHYRFQNVIQKFGCGLSGSTRPRDDLSVGGCVLM